MKIEVANRKQSVNDSVVLNIAIGHEHIERISSSTDCVH